MSDLISRQQAIDALENDKAALDKIIKGMSAEDMLLKYYVAQHNQVSCDIYAIVQLPPAQPDITNIILETLHECGIYGEEATIKLIGTLKRIGRDDLIPPCAR